MEIVEFETAKLCKSLNIKLETSYNYYTNQSQWYHKQNGNLEGYNYFGHFDNMLYAPYQTTVQDYLRKEHKIHITITSISQESWQYHITKPGEPLGIVVGEDYDTYEEALEEGLFKALTSLE